MTNTTPTNYQLPCGTYRKSLYTAYKTLVLGGVLWASGEFAHATGFTKIDKDITSVIALVELAGIAAIGGSVVGAVIVTGRRVILGEKKE